MQFYDKDGRWIEVPKPEPLDKIIRAVILNALAYTDGNQKEAAKLLKITERSFGIKMDSLGIPRSRN